MLYLLGQEEGIYFSFLPYITAQKKFSSKGFFSKCEVILSFLRIWSHLLKKFSMKNFIFCAVYIHEVPRNIHEKKTLDPQKYRWEKIWTHEITTRKKFLLTHEGTKARWHDGTRPCETYDDTRPTEFTTFYKKEESRKNLKTIKLYTDNVFSALYLPS